MACCMRLTTLLALLYLPVGGFVSPSVGIPISRLAPSKSIIIRFRSTSSTSSNTSSGTASSSSSTSTSTSTSSRRSTSSTSTRVSPPRAFNPGGSWSAMEVTAAREALINSEGFKILAKRAEDRSPAAAAAAAIGHGHGLGTSTSIDAPGVLSGVGLGSGHAGSSTATLLRSAEVTTKEEDATTNSSGTTWKRNAAKLKSLRATVLDSGRAREIAGKLRLAQLDNNNNRKRSRNHSAAHRLEESLPRLQETAQPPPLQGASFDDMADSPQQRASYDDMAVGNDAKKRTTAGGGGGGEARSPERARGMRWIRRITTRVSHVGRQARGRVARVYGMASGKTDDTVQDT